MSDSTQFTRLADLTSHAFATAAKANPVILLPLGSHEDHGPHQPMGDYVLADSIAARIASRATATGTPAFVAPALPYGVADYFGGSPGGLALSAETFRCVLQDVLDGLLRHDLRKIIIINAHGGNVPVIHAVTLGIKRRGGPVIPSFYLWKIARELMESRFCTATGRFGHGAEPLLSLNLAEPFALVAALLCVCEAASSGRLWLLSIRTVMILLCYFVLSSVSAIFHKALGTLGGGIIFFLPPPLLSPFPKWQPCPSNPPPANAESFGHIPEHGVAPAPG